jgi:predicted site-specific integrase-resolvase
MSMAAKREIGYLIVENRDRLSRFGFDLVEKMLNELGAKVIVVSNIDNKSYEKELTDDLISIIHYYSMKSYSMRRKLHNAEQALITDSKQEI